MKYVLQEEEIRPQEEAQKLKESQSTRDNGKWLSKYKCTVLVEK